MSKNLYNAFKYFAYGLQFTMIVVVPFLVCIFIGGWLQKKYGLGDWVTGLSIVIALVIMIADLYSFGRMILNGIKKDARSDKKK